MNPRFCTICYVYMTLIYSCCITSSKERTEKRWYIGRTPPSCFEYSKINGYYTPKQAKTICEKDVQCGGFTFKGSQWIKYVIPEVYFFHFINDSSAYLTTDIKYPHWTSYIVGSRDYILVSGSYASDKSSSHSRYESFIYDYNFDSNSKF